MSNIGNKETFAKNLSYYMMISSSVQKDVAEKVGVATSTFNDWMKARKYPRIDKIEKLADYFGILKSDLIEEKKEPADYNDRLTQRKLAFIEKVKQMSEAELERLDQILRIVESTK